nr:hypothetical protein [uncultured Desulfobulbus sp.]
MEAIHGGFSNFFCPECGNQTFKSEKLLKEIKDLVGAKCLVCGRKVDENDIKFEGHLEQEKESGYLEKKA